MLCKFCNAEMEDDRRYCPVCGKRQDAKMESEQEKKEQKKKADTGTWKLIVGIALGLVIAGLLVAVLVSGSKKDADAGQETTTAPTTETTTPVIQAPESEYSQQNGVVVAKLLDAELTNDLLQIYYTSTAYDFMEEYSSIISSLGLDPTKPFDEQAFPQEGAETWGEYFMDLALEQWMTSVAICALAKENGFVLSDEWNTMIEEQINALETTAKENNYASAEAMVKMNYGDSCTVESYRQYMFLEMTANAYYMTFYEVTDEQIEQSFQENKDTFAEQGITKNGTLVSNVRHILIQPEGGTKSEDGKTTIYSDAEWEACKQKAEQVLEEWKKGDATEESFAALVSKYTADTASVSTGGLYENIVNDGTYVKEFQDWAIDATRKKGDTELVKTSFGYHIMYFVDGEQEWIAYSRMYAQQKQLEQAGEKADQLREDSPVEITYERIALQNIFAR